MTFRVHATDGAARAGVLDDLARRHPHAGVHAGRHEGHGQVAAPRRGSRRSAPRSSSATRTTCTSARATTSSSELGGLHAFSGWSGPILTDSGGFQVFSLRDTIAALDDDGVTFRSRLRRRRGAVHARTRGGDPAPTRLRHRDVPRRLPAGRRAARRARTAVETHDALGRAAGRRPASAAGQLRFGIAQGGTDESSGRRSIDGDHRAPLRRVRSRRSRRRRVDDRDVRLRRVGRAAAARRQAALLHGHRDPRGILEVVARGIDLFDCVLPTRTARTGSALTWDGRLNLRNAVHRSDPRPARRRVRLPGVRALLARLPPPPRHPERDPGDCGCSACIICGSYST